METRSVGPEFTSSEFGSLVHRPLSLGRQAPTYCKHFGFAESPFSITSDPQFFYSNTANERILAALGHEIGEKGAFVALTGEPGTGKTTLLKKLIGDSADRIDYILIGVSARMSFIGLFQEILKEADVRSISSDRESLLEQFDAYLKERRAEDRSVVLVFDEAQAISDEVLKELSLLCSSEGSGLSILLAGQPGLQGRLAQLKPLKQRMALTKRLVPLKRDDVASYIALRLYQVGYHGEELFEQQAIDKIVDVSEGIPRVINSICDCALLLACRASERKITAEIIDRVAYELRLGGRSPSMDQRTAAAMIELRNLKRRAFLAPLVEAEKLGGSLEHEESEVQRSPVEQSTTMDHVGFEDLAQSQNLAGPFLAPPVEAKEMGDSVEPKENMAQCTANEQLTRMGQWTLEGFAQSENLEGALLAPVVEAEEINDGLEQENEARRPPVEHSIGTNQRAFEGPAQLQNLARAFLASFDKVRGVLAQLEQEKKELRPKLPVGPSISMRQTIAAELLQRWNRARAFVAPQVKIRLTEAAHKWKQLGEQLVQFSSVNGVRLAIGALVIVVAAAWSFLMLYPQQRRNVSESAVEPREKNPPQKAALVRVPETTFIDNKTMGRKPGQLVPVSIPSVAVANKNEPLKEAKSESPKDLAGAKKPADSPAVSKAERPASEELYRVSGASFVRNKPTDNAEIIDTLQPGVRIAIINRSGEYFRVRSLGERSVSGFVHKEDAFFERIQ